MNWTFPVPHVPDFHFICQVKRHSSQLAHTLTYWEAFEGRHQLLLVVFCKPKVRNDLLHLICWLSDHSSVHFGETYFQTTFSINFLHVCLDKVILDMSGGLRGRMWGGLLMGLPMAWLRWLSGTLGNYDTTLWPCADKEYVLIVNGIVDIYKWTND